MQVRFSAVTPAEVRGALKATGSTDPDVLLAAREEFASRYRPLKWMGIWAIVSGALATALVLTAFIGIPLFFVGIFWLRRAGRNLRTIEAAFAEHLAAARGATGGAPMLQALSLLLLLGLALPGGLAAQNDAALPEWVGDWGPKGSCAGPLKLVVAPKQVTLVNGKDWATEGNLTVAASYFGASYQGIMLVLLADWDKRQPFIVTFNAGEKRGDAVVEFSNPDQALQRRFPFTPTTVLRKCAGKPAGAVGAAPAAPTPVCGGAARCVEVTPFAATITDFRVSKAGGNDKIISFTVRFQNKTQAPLILGYVQQSGLVLDDQGVRFGAYGANALRGIGTITGSTFDPKFVLQPGESGDARVEVASRTQQGTIFGTVYDAEFAVREIEPLPGDQYQLGREHLLQWKGLTPAATAAAASTGGAGATAPTAAGAGAIPASPVGDACGGAPRCYGAGPFTATVTQVTTSKSGGYQTMRIAVKVRNVASEPMILGFKSGSQTATDDVGDRLRSKNEGVKGIGLVASNSADPQFRLAPGQERGFTLDYFKGIYKGTVLGTTWGADFVLTQLEILPSQQVRTVRDYAIGFTELRGGAASAAGGTTGSDAAAVVNTLGRLIRKK